MTHRSIKHSSALPATLDELSSYVGEKFVEGAKQASTAFTEAGIRHVLVGGLAVGMNGYPRHTRDIDFLVEDKAFDFHGLLVTPKANLPMKYDDIDIDWVSLEPSEREALDVFMVIPLQGEVPVIPVEALVFMKLLTGRSKDHTDVVEMMKARAIQWDSLKNFIMKFKPRMIPTLKKLAATAEKESR